MSMHENIEKNMKTFALSNVFSTQLFWMLTFAVLTFLSAQVAIPVEPVPFTMQTMLVVLSGAFLGSKNGFYAQAVYVAAGTIGIPVFANFAFGPAVIFGPTGGYLLAFPFAAFLTGFFIEKKNDTLTVILSMIAGTILILLSGSIYLTVFFRGDFNQALFSGALIFSLWDVIKISAAVSIYLALKGRYPKLP